ncbi:uncharacterized protein LOC121740788 isoform X1 [Salvia splendens]|uniref:uncharacterized protein LOC121740788 isoform X1 n=2 Tax=Salvia splendens TaxID=180675 RepID=UPI001C255F83|nr:uncharacterized protein LOC121740788 isoform X1 [Salvia splendens]
MGFKYLMILLLLPTILCSRKEPLKLDRKSKIQKNHAILSIHSEDGDIIDCIDIYKQPAFDHPALKDHKIQMSPSQSHEDVAVQSETGRGSRVSMTSQLWHKNGSCPKGTVPIRRAKDKHLPNYGRKKAMFSHHNGSIGQTWLRPNYALGILHTEGYAYIGGKADMLVQYPKVELDDEYSTSRVALKTGPYYDFEAMEAGWQVNPTVYGDRKTRLFVYWTIDAANKTGCFDLTCPGFVQTSSEIALGAVIYPIAEPNDLPYQITIFIYRDPYTGNWWMQYGEQTNIGYWPPELFVRIRNQAETVQWGGEVHSKRVGVHPHTATAMGSGQWPFPTLHNSGLMTRMRVLLGNVLKFPDWAYVYADEYRCYDVVYVSDYVYDPEFYFGGPGKSWECP